MNIYLVVLCGLLIGAVEGDSECGIGGSINECASGCDVVPTCRNPSPGPPDPNIACPAVCLRRCSCHRGYVLHNGRCVRLSSCPKVDECGIGGVMNECASPCNAVPTCKNPNPGPPDPTISCIAACVRRCSCYKGYVLHNGRCVRLASCPKDPCAPGGHLNLCASRCDPVPTCANPNPAPLPPGRVCTLECVQRCSCYRGYVLHNDRCIKLNSCPNYVSYRP